ncbi:MAG: alpha/beta hydrolase fold domain-containing protein [Alphaproteobacteria bacterium]|nr:alpha/beta hydrolase fold domain-containing protein [Alphaproteobacteria bacterium]
MPLHPQAQDLLDTLTSTPTPLNQLPPTEARAAYRRFIESRNYDPDPVARVEDREIDGPHGPIPLRIFWPANTPGGPLPVFVFYFGGGFVIGSIESREPQCRKIANETGCIVVAPYYRQAPEHKFPAAHDDAWAAAQWVAANATALGGDPVRLAVGGDSAGANMTAVIAQQARKVSTFNIALQVLVYPSTDFFFTLDLPSYALLDEPYFLTRQQIDWYHEQFLPDDVDRGDLRLGPALAKDFSRLPPALIITAEFDPLRDDGKHYGDLLSAAGVPVEYTCYDGMIHGFFHYGKTIDAATTSLAQVIDALRRAFTD